MPYFGKQSNILPPFSYPPKRTILRGFPDRGVANGALFGLIFPQVPYPCILKYIRTEAQRPTFAPGECISARSGGTCH